MLWFANEARYWALKLQMDTNLPPLMPDGEKNFRGSLVLDFRKWWRHVKTIYWRIVSVTGNDFLCFVARNIRLSCDSVTPVRTDILPVLLNKKY